MLLAFALATVAVGGAWSLTTILSPAAAVSSDDPFTTVHVVDGSVGASLTLNIAAQWVPTPAATNEAAGIVTSVDLAPGGLADQGTRLYAVNQRPVVVAAGSVPAYRDLTRGCRGADVAQLQAMLVATGYLAAADAPASVAADASSTAPADAPVAAPVAAAGAPTPSAADAPAASVTASAVVDEATAAAIERWQAALGVEPTGDVRLGDVVFVPTLPMRLSLKPDVVRRGATLGGGEEAVLALGSAPVFTLPVSASESSGIPSGTRITIDATSLLTPTAPAGPSTPPAASPAATDPAAAPTVPPAIPPTPASPTTPLTATPPTITPPPATPPTATGPISTPPSTAPPAASHATGEARAADRTTDATGSTVTIALAATGDQPICAQWCDSVPATGQTLLPSTVVTVETVHGAVLPSIALRSDAAHAVFVLDDSGVAHPVTVLASAQGMSAVTGVDSGTVVRIPAPASGSAR